MMDSNIEYLKNIILLRFKQLDSDWSGLPIVKNDTLNNFKLISLSVSIPIIWDEKLSPSMTLEKLQSVFWDDIRSNIIREIVKNIYYCKDEQHINLINALDKDASSRRTSEQIGDLIFSYLYHGSSYNPASNLIAGTRVISGYIMESSAYTGDVDRGASPRVNLVYETGKLGQSNVFVDATTSWSEEATFWLFERLEYNIQDVTLYEVYNDPHTIGGRLVVKFKLDTQVISACRVDIIEKMDSKSYRKWISEIRNDKIDKLIN